VVDAQSGHEKTITGILPALAGANVIYGLGMLEMGITFNRRHDPAFIKGDPG
jgi:trimethylamine--corrinoid protein Co-methyltransferase